MFSIRRKSRFQFHSKVVEATMPRLFWIATGWLGFLGVAILSLLPAESRPHTGVGGQLEHLVAYALVAGSLGIGHKSYRDRLIVGLTLTCGAALLELLQLFIPGRNSEFAGFLAGFFGISLGLGLAVFFARSH